MRGVLCMVVVRLHQAENFIIGAAAVPVARAVVALLQLDDPDTLTGRATCTEDLQ